MSDKRLAIDLSGLRQLTWRQQGEEQGDPLLTDRLPADGTTKLLWTNTAKMAADALTKVMRPTQLLMLMGGEHSDLTPENVKACEIEPA